MRIIHIMPGTGALYCGVCQRDAALARALAARGHEVLIVPLFAPLKLDDPSGLNVTEVRFGAAGTCLRQCSVALGLLSSPLRGLLDSPRLLNALASAAFPENPAALGGIAVSLLQGADGRQKREVARLAGFVAGQPKPDVVSLSTSLLSGLAPVLKDRLDCKVVCSLHGEETFVELLREPHRSEARRQIRRNARFLDLALAQCKSHAARATEFLALPPIRMRTVYPGIEHLPFARLSPRARQPFTVGYLSPISYYKGLDTLVEAFGLLAAEHRTEVRLRVGGKILDKSFWQTVLGRVAKLGLESVFEYVGEPDLARKAEFLQSLSVFCAPSRMFETRALGALEAMAARVPVAAPQAGCFPELLEAAPGGIMYPPGDCGYLASTLAEIMADADAADAIGKDGAAGVEQNFTAALMAERFERALENA